MLTGAKKSVSKKARREKSICITDLHVHLRLHIYSFLNGELWGEGRDEIFRSFDFLWDFPYCPGIPKEPFAIITTVACILGDLDALQYLNSIPANPWVPERCTHETKNYKCFQWAKRSHFPWNEWTFNAAIRKGGTQMIKIAAWLHKNGCPFTEKTFRIAVESGNMDILE